MASTFRRLSSKSLHRSLKMLDMTKPARFSPGQLVVTNACMQAFHISGDRIVPFLLRHVNADWGDVDPEDRRANDYALLRGLRLLSVYHLSDGTKIWVITEAGFYATTFLLPSEY
jgi:hypothetical protein